MFRCFCRCKIVVRRRSKGRRPWRDFEGNGDRRRPYCQTVRSEKWRSGSTSGPWRQSRLRITVGVRPPQAADARSWRPAISPRAVPSGNSRLASASGPRLYGAEAWSPGRMAARSKSWSVWLAAQQLDLDFFRKALRLAERASGASPGAWRDSTRRAHQRFERGGEVARRKRERRARPRRRSMRFSICVSVAQLSRAGYYRHLASVARSKRDERRRCAMRSASHRTVRPASSGYRRIARAIEARRPRRFNSKRRACG